MIKPNFRADKATQVAATLIARSGGKIPVLKLVKLMYLIEREALDSYGRPIIYDSFYNLPHGPIVSRTLNLINKDASAEDAVIWDQHIRERDKGHDVSLGESVSFSVLSSAELAVIEKVFEKFGHMSKWQLREYTHQLPEWKDPEETSIPLSYADVLAALGKSEAKIEAILSELHSVALAEQVFG